jgi:hypothetical protein
MPVRLKPDPGCPIAQAEEHRPLGTGTDSSSSSHPVRTVTWTVNDGTQNLRTTSQVTVDRPPVVAAATGFDVIGTTLAVAAASGVLSSETDPDGDLLTVTGVSDLANGAGTVGQSLAGIHAHYTLNANGSYSYISDLASSIANAPTGSSASSLAGGGDVEPHRITQPDPCGIEPVYG